MRVLGGEVLGHEGLVLVRNLLAKAVKVLHLLAVLQNATMHNAIVSEVVVHHSQLAQTQLGHCEPQQVGRNWKKTWGKVAAPHL
jgi:hypothetical protein